MEQVKVHITRESDGSFSAFVDDAAPINYGLIGEGKTVQEAIDEWNRMYEGMKQSYAEDNMHFVEAEFTFVYDNSSFLAYCSEFVSLKSLSKATGISTAQLSQYVTGYRHPSPGTVKRLKEGLRNIAQKINQVAN